MNPRDLTKTLLALACASVPVFTSSCMTAKVIDPGDVAGGSDEIDTRVAVNRTGQPVSGARIALLRASDSTGKPVALSATAADGTYPRFVVPDGYYAVVLRDSTDSLGKFVDSLRIVGQKVPVGRDTLLSLGSVRGVVRVGGGQSPTTVTIGLLGTDIVANVNTDGTFWVELVPGSLYTLAALPRLDGYGPLYKRIQLKDGQNLVLPDTLVIPFTGLPTPAGLRVLEDSVTGNVKLLWNRVDHPDLMGYVVEKVEAGSVTASAYLTDTVWTDSLRGYWEGLPLLGPWPAREVAYRVRSRSLSGAPDSRRLAAAFTAVAPAWTKGVDSVRVVVVSDTGTGNVRVSWNRAVHPALAGYVVEQIEAGVVGSSLATTDTAWTDSLGRDWEALPLLGPWPVRDLSYRVRMVSRIAGADALGAETTIQVKPPEWTKRVDSVRMKVTQDTATGDVHVSWTRPKHPLLKGFIVERLEGDQVLSSSFLADTTWTDSLGQYWEALPLLGPWPARDVAYRVRSRSLNGTPDSRSLAVTFTAVAPGWTNHVDSVKVVMVTDSVTGVTRLSWNTPIHPDLKGWSVTRIAKGFSNCFSVLDSNEWDDGHCQNILEGNLVESATEGKPIINLLKPRSVLVEFHVQSRRKFGADEVVGVQSRSIGSDSLVVWRDSLAEGIDGNSRVRVFGGWIQLSSAVGAAKISRDGLNWENVPHSFQQMTGLGDSLWTVALDADSIHVQLGSRKAAGVWSFQRLTLPTKSVRLSHLSLQGGMLVFGYALPGDFIFAPNDTILVLQDGVFKPGKIGRVGPYSTYIDTYSSVPVSDRIRLDETTIYGYPNLQIVVDGTIISTKTLDWPTGGCSYLIGAYGKNGAAIVSFTGFRHDFAYVPVSGDAKLISGSSIGPNPGGFADYPVVFQDEIWVVRSGHIWKGKLNLPK